MKLLFKLALYNTYADAANTAVRAFLTEIGEYYWGKSFNTSSGKAKKDWETIRDQIFSGECAYCGISDSQLQIEHLIMFNRTEFGLHHPGNIVPSCKECNSRSKKMDGTYNTWEEHLSFICEKNDQKEEFYYRWNKIKKHISEGVYKYPKLSSEEEKAIQIIANNLYDCIKKEFSNAIKLYEELGKEFTGKQEDK